MGITRDEFLSIYKNRGKKVHSNISFDSLFRKVKYLKKQDLIHLATIGGLVFDGADLDNVIQALYRNVFINKLKPEIYRDIEKRKYARIIKKVKRLKRLKNNSLAKKENISEEDLIKLKKCALLSTKTLRKLIQLRGVQTIGLSKTDLMYILILSEKTNREDNYLQHLLSEPTTHPKTLINVIKQNIKLDRLLSKSDKNKIRNRLYEIENLNPSKRQTKILIKELIKISNNLDYKKEHTPFDSSGYYGIKDLEDMFDDLDNYYDPILV